MRLFHLIPLAGFFAGPALSAESVYTDFNFDRDCLALATDVLGGTWSCAGYQGFGILMSEGDLRQSIFYGHIGAWYAETAWESFGAFNSAGERIEWRVDAGRPVATIRRWTLDNPDPATGEATDASRGQVLVVSKVGQPGEGEACVTGYVDARANPDANAIARRVADAVAPGFACRNDEPQWHGVRGPQAGDPARNFGGGVAIIE